MRKTNSGVTLIALIITIIVLLILAGVTIAMIVGENGILNRATDAAVKTEQASIKETMDLVYTEYTMLVQERNLVQGNSARVASLDIVNIDRYAMAADPLSTFSMYLMYEKNCMDPNGKIYVDYLLGTELSTGKGSVTSKKDVYILERTSDKYILKYYDDNSNSEEIWQASKTPTITIELKYSDSGETAVELEYEEGMTWDDWMRTEYRNLNVYYNSGGMAYEDSEETRYIIQYIGEDGSYISVNENDLITNEYEYVLVLSMPK